MTKFHSTISRRTFMKALGLAGAGLGAAAATTPVFHDLDEMTGSYTNFKYPWWIKEVDEPTVPLDWSQIDMSTPFSRYSTSVPTAANRRARQIAGMKQNIKGSRLKDYSLARAHTNFDFGRGVTTSSPWGDWMKTRVYFDIKDMDVPAYSGTNGDENLAMVRAALHYFGAPRLGVARIDPSTNRKLFNPGVEWGSSVTEPYEKVDGTRVVPSSVQYNLCWPVLQQPQVARCTKEVNEGGPIDGYPPFLGKATTYMGYWDVAVIQYRIRRFLVQMGILALDLSNLPVAFGPLQVAEYCRADMACSPEFGMAIRLTDTLQTNLPLSETKPIDGGVHKFCEQCGRCGENCPTDSIPLEKGPPTGEVYTHEGAPVNQNPGVLSWRMKWASCVDYGSPVDCHICQWSCPFNHALDPGGIHQAVVAMIGTTSVFNGFFADMDRQFDYAKQIDPDDWWNRDLSKWKWDSIAGRGAGQNY